MYALLQTDVSVPEQTATQYWLALAGIIALVALLTIAVYRFRYAGLDESNRQHKASIIGAKFDQTPLTFRIPGTADPGSHRENLRRLFESALSGEGTAPDRATVREAVREVRFAIGEALDTRLSGVPALAVRVGEVALGIAVFGAVAVSTSAVVSLLQTGAPGVGSGGNLLTKAASLTFDVVGAGGELFAMFPYFDLFYALALTVVIRGTDYAYHHWRLWAILLGLGALLIVAFDRRVTGDIDVRLYGKRWRVASSVIGALVAIWLAGVVPAGLGQLAGIPTVGAVLGFLLALVVGIWMLYAAARHLWMRVRAAATGDWGGYGFSSTVAAYLVCRRLAASLAVALSPLIPLYLVVIVITGRGGRVWHALWTAPLETQAVLLLVAGGLLALVAWEARSAWPDLRGGLVERLSRTRVRAALFRRGLPYLGLGVGYVAGYAITRSIVLALVLAILVAVGTRTIYVVAMRVRHRVGLLGETDPLSSSVVVEAFGLPDADDERHLVVRLNGGRELAFDDVERAVETVVEVAGPVSDGEEPPVTVAEHFATDLQRYGIVDRETTVDKLERQIHEAALRTLRDEDGKVDAVAFKEALEDYPNELCEEKRSEWRKRNVVRERGESVTLERDPFRTTG